MKKRLLDIIFASDKRRNALLLLQNGPQKMDYLLKSLETTRNAILPQMKILEEHYLVFHYDNNYELTSIGKLIVDDMVPLLNTIEPFDNDVDYWGTHDIDFIPPHLLNRLDTLRKCEVITPSHLGMYDLDEKILQTSLISKSHYGILTFYHYLFPRLISNMLSNNADVHMIVSPSVLDKFRTECPSEFEKFLQSEFFHFYVYTGNIGFLGLACNDYYFMLRLLKNNGDSDINRILCNGKGALEWGMELFEYYLKDSTSITEI
ncbi:winged helix-turn-helix domain-containing protein [Methanolobus sediminis]|uniref:Winged helix-turn-helix domain-containing protein n=1 Tax=Methanolobus sediminis TaxID=3072978 RepID=A0AA51YM47_9EURY|nr:winged helix-turn-helix domain-containing protein [Methanolobus sediminis]WMW25572.1 winged helix-turn-helix domain-containing protein [Methanolobus sediminis]